VSRGFDPTLYAVTVAAIPALIGLLQNGNLLRQFYRGNELLALGAMALAGLGLAASLWALATEENAAILRYAALVGIAALGVWVIVLTAILIRKWNKGEAPSGSGTAPSPNRRTPGDPADDR
jgi:hypothetical protein